MSSGAEEPDPLDDLRPLAVIEPREYRSESEEKMDAVITGALLTVLCGGLLVAALYWLVPVALGPKQAAACPNASEQLNAYEYELQRRRCEAVKAGAVRQIEGP